MLASIQLARQDTVVEISVNATEVAMRDMCLPGSGKITGISFRKGYNSWHQLVCGTNGHAWTHFYERMEYYSDAVKADCGFYLLHWTKYYNE